MRHRLANVAVSILAAGAALALGACEGAAGAAGTAGTSCTVMTNADGSATIRCTDGTMANVPRGMNGTPGTTGMDGTSCTVTDNLDGTKTISCTDGTTVTVSDGGPGTTGDPGRDAWVVGEGLRVTVTGVTIPADRQPVVSVTITDGADRPLDRTGVHTLGEVSVNWLIAYLPSDATSGVGQYVNYITRMVTVGSVTATQPASEPSTGMGSGTWTEVDPAAGTYTYRFAFALPAGYDATKTHTVGAYATRTFDGVRYVANPLFDFRPDGMAVTETRAISTTATCNNCHNTLAVHGGARRELGLCVMCHTAGMSDPDTQNSISAPVMIHKIHMGEHLPSVVAGTPYEIIGFRGSVNDYSTVAFPQGPPEDCATCHTGADGGRWLTRPTREVCTSCHDRTSFVSPAPAGFTMHSGGARADDSACTTCHTNGATDPVPGIAGAHWTVDTDPANPHLLVVINSVSNTGPTQQPIVDFTVTTGGTGRDILTSRLTGLNFVFAGPNAPEFVGQRSYAAQAATAASDVGVIAAVDAAAGHFTWTSPDTVTAIAASLRDSNNNVIGAPATGSFTVGVEGNIRASSTAPRYATDNTMVAFGVTDTTAVPRRQVIENERCLACHGEAISVHGGSRRSPEYCVMCHSPNWDTISRMPPGVTGAPARTVSLRLSYMIHSIHRGEERAKPYGAWTPPSAGPPIVYNPIDFSEIRFPGDLRDCQTCHLAGTYELPLPDLPPSRTSDIDASRARVADYFTQATAAACGGCHASDLASAHFDAMTTAIGVESCGICHGAGREFGVDVVHARPGL